MDLAKFSFDLPEILIGQKAIEPRDSCRLLVVNRSSNQISHHKFTDLSIILDHNTVLVLNDTKVFPARLFGKKSTCGKTEILLLKQLSFDSYLAIGKGKLRPGTKIIFSPDFLGEVFHEHEGKLHIRFNKKGVDLIKSIDRLGRTPLPSYIHSDVDEKDLRKQYQTIYAREKGSAAAPTAGLHFTNKLINDLVDRGVQVEKVTLHVGLGTFKPVTEEQIASKTLHSENFSISIDTAERLNTAKKAGKKIIAVGTTTCRVLETQANDLGEILPGEGETNIFIQPGFKYKFVDGLITNFHLPGTSLLMLVAALVCFPNSPIEFSSFQSSLVGKAYSEAITQKYKFFSFGDAMLIV